MEFCVNCSFRGPSCQPLICLPLSDVFSIAGNNLLRTKENSVSAYNLRFLCPLPCRAGSLEKKGNLGRNKAKKPGLVVEGK